MKDRTTNTTSATGTTGAKTAKSGNSTNATNGNTGSSNAKSVKIKKQKVSRPPPTKGTQNLEAGKYESQCGKTYIYEYSKDLHEKGCPTCSQNKKYAPTFVNGKIVIPFTTQLFVQSPCRKCSQQFIRTDLRILHERTCEGTSTCSRCNNDVPVLSEHVSLIDSVESICEGIAKIPNPNNITIGPSSCHICKTDFFTYIERKDHMDVCEKKEKHTNNGNNNNYEHTYKKQRY